MKLNPEDLEQVDADVVLVSTNETTGTVHVMPLWGCEVTKTKLLKQAAVYGLSCAEEDAAGDVTVQVFDYR